MAGLGEGWQAKSNREVWGKDLAKALRVQGEGKHARPYLDAEE